MPVGRQTPIGKPGWGNMLSVVDGGLTSIPWEDLDSTLVQAIQRESDGLTLGDLKDRLRPQDAIETIPGGDEYVVTNTNAPNSPCHVPVPDGVSECGLSKLPSSIHSDDETEQDAFFVQTCVEEVENAEYVAPLKPLLSMRGGEPLQEELDSRSARSLFLFVTGATPGGTMGRLSTTECTYPTLPGLPIQAKGVRGLQEEVAGEKAMLRQAHPQLMATEARTYGRSIPIEGGPRTEDHHLVKGGRS